MLVGGDSEAILGASVALHEVAFRMDNVAANLVTALGPAATTVVATAPFAPVQAAAVQAALAVVLGGPAAGLGQVAAAYEAASYQLRAAGQALEVAGLATLVGSGAVARLKGRQVTVLASADGLDVTREALSFGLSTGAAGVNEAVTVREVARPDGSTFYVVELATTPRAAAGLGAQVNGAGGYVESGTGLGATLRWAVATREEAELLVSQVSLSLAPVIGDALTRSLPTPTEATFGDVSSAKYVGTALLFVATAAATATIRREATFLSDGGQRLAVTVSGAGEAGVSGVAGAGGSASLRLSLERDRSGAVTSVTVTRAIEVDRGRHGLAALEAVNREATLEEREWELEVTPELRARADRVGSALASRRAPDEEDLRALADAVTGLEPTVRTYDVRHQQLSADVAIEKAQGGGSIALDTARLRRP